VLENKEFFHNRRGITAREPFEKRFIAGLFILVLNGVMNWLFQRRVKHHYL